jgi:membrane-bound lytic murein transglycosylase MltF
MMNEHWLLAGNDMGRSALKITADKCKVLMSRSRVAVGRLGLAYMLAVLSLCFCACNRKQSPTTAADGTKPVSPHLADENIAPPEAISASAETGPGTLTLPVSMRRRTDDLPQMLKERNIRALVLINPIGFFYQNGKPRGITYEALEEFERFVNTKFKSGALKIKVTYIPMRPDELASALTEGAGDFVAQPIAITPARQEKYVFTTPILTNVAQIVVTGNEFATANSFDDLADKNIYVNPLSSYHDELVKLSAEREKTGKRPLSIKPADKNLTEDDLIEMVNAGLIPATVTTQTRAALWQQVLPSVKPHPEMVVASGVNMGWVMRKNNPELKKLLDEFAETHREGTSFGNTLLRRYLQNTKWIKNSTSADEMKKFASYVEYFKKYSGEYHFDYLMIAAQAYQESLLDQSKKSRVGAVGIMQVIPKFAAAKPISVPDVSTADKNILAGVRILRNIADTYFNDPGIDPVNKTLFTFASYNAGPNRIARLRKKAEADGLDRNKWFGNVELEVAEDVGQETVTYVDNIYKYFIAYKLSFEMSEEKKKAKAAAS